MEERIGSCYLMSWQNGRHLAALGSWGLGYGVRRIVWKAERVIDSLGHKGWWNGYSYLFTAIPFISLLTICTSGMLCLGLNR